MSRLTSLLELMRPCKSLSNNAETCITPKVDVNVRCLSALIMVAITGINQIRNEIVWARKIMTMKYVGKNTAKETNKEMGRADNLMCARCYMNSLLDEPNPNSPANSLAAQLYQDNKREYEKRVATVVELSWLNFQETRIEDPPENNTTH
uniref:Uncharacterized protein n=1 Tax=Timema poppense TaxID=170557 RepID=A0A7R9H655_TIMPO|nr:unnamed protein product [Timema poppensis]